MNKPLTIWDGIFLIWMALLITGQLIPLFFWTVFIIVAGIASTESRKDD